MERVRPPYSAMTRFSVLDLVPVNEGGTVGEALGRAADFAAHAESLGFHRYWVAEHHGMPGIASAATAVVLAHIGRATDRIRIGAGDRKSVGSGKSGSVRVEHGGRRILKKKNRKRLNNN